MKHFLIQTNRCLKTRNIFEGIEKEGRIIDECYDRARHIIRKYDDVLHACADLLLEKEKISREEFEALFPEDVSED